jgi:hypothetical protein
MSGEEYHIEYVPESPNVGMTFVGWSAIGSLLLLLLSIGGLYAIYHGVVPTTAPPVPQTFPQPRVDASEGEELRRITGAQKAKLETWRWADSQHTTAQVPIERAMQLLAKKGADAYEPLLPPASLSSPAAAAEGAATPAATTTGASPSRPEPHK